MARKRLLTILAAAVAAIGLQVAPATALDVDRDIGDLKVEASVSEEGIEAEVGDEEDKLGAKVSEDGVDVKVGDEEVSTGDKTEDAEEAVDADEDDADEDDEASSKETAGSDAGEPDDTREVTTAGDAEAVGGDDHERPDALDPQQARQFLPGASEGVDLSASREDITPSFDLSRDDDVAEPLIAAAPETSNDGATADWEPVEPPTSERSDAELAAIPAPGSDGGAVPAGLKLLAGLMVAGTGTLWHLARRELGTPGSVQVG